MNVGAPEEPVALNLFSLIGGSKTLAGSMIGGIAETQEMLDFCAEHGLGAEIELIAADRDQRGVRAGRSTATCATGS